MKCYWNIVTQVVSMLFMTTVVLQQQGGGVLKKTIWSAKLKIFTIYLWTEKFADPSIRLSVLDLKKNLLVDKNNF